MQCEDMIVHAIKAVVKAVKDNPDVQVQQENKAFPVRKEYGK